MTRKRIIGKICLAAGLIVVAVVVGTLLLRGLRNWLHPPLTKEEVRILLRGVGLPESLDPEAVQAVYYQADAGYKLRMRIRVKGVQADELLDAWLEGTSRSPSDSEEYRYLWEEYERKIESSLLPIRDDDICVFKNFRESFDVQFILRKRDAGVDIHCMLGDLPTVYVAEETRAVMYKGQWFRLGPGGSRGERRLGEFGPD